MWIVCFLQEIPHTCGLGHHVRLIASIGHDVVGSLRKVMLDGSSANVHEFDCIQCRSAAPMGDVMRTLTRKCVFNRNESRGVGWFTHACSGCPRHARTSRHRRP
jgi:hypothetical protein